VGVDSVNHLDWERLGSRVVCTNLGSVLAEPMAQSVLAGLLALHRCIDQLVLLQARRDWQKARIHPQMAVLCGHVLLLGGGAVNRRLRELLGVFGCTFTVYARNTGDIRTPAELDEVLPRADLVCAALPDTPQTRGLLDQSRLARFKRGALLANVGRGSLVDELALVDALKGHALGGAVLDVTCEEPLPASSPLWNCPRLLLTQHTAAGSRDVHLDVVEVFLANLARYRRGEPLFHPIDWSKGY
jgi:phosphoglycerate dehydrogenase-like enzyme